MARRVPCRLVTFGDKASRRLIGDLEVVTLRTRHTLRGHPAHPLGTGLGRALWGASIIHTHQMRSAPSRAAALAAKALRIPVVVTDHGLGGGGWWGILPRLFDGYLPVSHHSAATLRIPASKMVRVVRGGVDTERFPPRDGPRQGVLYVGRITPHKGIDRLIRALPPGASLSIVGTTGHDPAPPEREYPELLRRLAAGKKVRWLSAVSDDDLVRLYQSARVVVLPSVRVTCYGRRIAISELLGLTLLEAMASGAPVVCTRVGGPVETVHHGETGFVVDPGDVAQLRARLDMLLEDDALVRRMGRAGRVAIEKGWRWEQCAERCLAAYADVMGAE